MSWQSYIDNLVKTGDIDEAAIVGYQCNAEGIWAATEGYKNITVDEIKRLAGTRTDFGASGPCVGGMKCRMLRDNLDDEGLHSMQLKTVADGSGNAYMVCIGKTCKSFVIAKGKKDAQGGNVNQAVCSIVEYLRKNNS
ncbi:profilin-2 [Cynoglossus semilaevis]|uniref:Profilin n=1 Tax=Cynoglossus semilaevis TaxID=244447 RepID=A0A3P8V3N6_CYNSE|nr:profilin-2 [Cynoglossus semilaevis]